MGYKILRLCGNVFEPNGGHYYNMSSGKCYGVETAYAEELIKRQLAIEWDETATKRFGEHKRPLIGYTVIKDGVELPYADQTLKQDIVTQVKEALTW